MLSMINGTPFAWATLANLSISKTEQAGLAIVSPKTAFVFGLNALSISSSVESGEIKGVRCGGSQQRLCHRARHQHGQRAGLWRWL